MSKGSKNAEKAELPDTLEVALKSLEEIVEKLEDAELPLEDAIELFEKGSKLSTFCYSKLKDAEKKVEILVKKVPHPQSRDDFDIGNFDSHEAS